MQTETSISTWRPILDGALAENARSALHDIVNALPEPSAGEMGDPLLASGTSGLALLCGYLARAGFDDGENAVEFLAHAINAVATQRLGPSLFEGFTGIAWVTHHLQTHLLDQDDGDPNVDIDEVLKNFLHRPTWLDDYDLIGGLVGYGVYALERLPRPAAVTCLEQVIDHLDKAAERNSEGITWFTRPELLPPHQLEACPKGYYNVGLAHGVPGVIALLGQACAAGVNTAIARPLLDGAVTWLLGQKLNDSEQSTFSSWLVPGIEPSGCRVAWCYGDAGIASSLLLAARSVGDRVWEREALDIARRSAKRSREHAGVVDAGLCHGATGLGHIYNRLFQATGDPLFKEYTCFWFERAIEMRHSSQGIAGFSAFMPDKEGNEGWCDDPGLLTGAAGVALALLAATTNVEPSWDRMLLLSQSYVKDDKQI